MLRRWDAGERYRGERTGWHKPARRRAPEILIREAFGAEAERLLAALRGRPGQPRVDAGRRLYERFPERWNSLIRGVTGMTDKTGYRWLENGWRYLQVSAAPVPPRVCAWAPCGKSFAKRKQCERGRFCSKRCGALDRWSQQKRPAQERCARVECGQSFTPSPKSHPRPRHCSKRCAALVRWEERGPPRVEVDELVAPPRAA